MFVFNNDDAIYKFVDKILESENKDLNWLFKNNEEIKDEYIEFMEFLTQRGFVVRSSVSGNYLLFIKSIKFFKEHNGLTFEEVNQLTLQKISHNSLKISKISLICTAIFGVVAVLMPLIELLKK